MKLGEALLLRSQLQKVRGVPLPLCASLSVAKLL